MNDRYLEHFLTDEIVARRELEVLSEDYAKTGMYPCANGFVVWADRESDREL